MKEILLASSNAHKKEEISAILSPFDIKVLSLKDVGEKGEVRENGHSFKENADIKALHYYKRHKLPIIADDSGIEISYFGGYPGVLSARFMSHLSYREKMELILDIMKDVKDRKAYFVAHISFINDGKLYGYEGRLEGEIAKKIKGENGFGYDPIFYLIEYQKTIAELSDEDKNHVSHRYLALKEFCDDIKKNHII